MSSSSSHSHQPSIMATSPVERLQSLEIVEKEIVGCLTSAGQALAELSKDKPNTKQMDGHTTNFLKTLNRVEMELSKHINYLIQVSTGQAHEGSSYASQKVLQMAWHRTEHARSRVVELQRHKNAMIAQSQERNAAAVAAAAAVATAGSKAVGSNLPASLSSSMSSSSSAIPSLLPSSSSSELVSSSSSSKPIPIVKENP